MSSRGVNKVILVGNLGQDPDTRALPGGDSVANISVATSDSWKDKNTGEAKERTEWHRVVFFGKLAEIVGQYLRKGSKVYIEGRLQTRKWEKDGVERYSTEIVVDQRGTMQMLGGNQDGGGHAAQRPPASVGRPAQAPTGAPVPAGATVRQPDPAGFNDDIPF